MLNEILSVILAWISACITLALCAPYPMRRYLSFYRKRAKLDSSLPAPADSKGYRFFNKLYHVLKKVHVALGMILIGVAFLHGRFSDDKFGMNTGSVCLFLSILLALSFFARKVTGGKWLLIHRALTVAMLAMSAIHIALNKLEIE